MNNITCPLKTSSKLDEYIEGYDAFIYGYEPRHKYTYTCEYVIIAINDFKFTVVIFITLV